MKNENRTGFCQLEIGPTLRAFEEARQSRGYRDSHGLFFAEGIRSFIDALDHRYSVDKLLYSERLLIHPLARKLVRRLKRTGVPFARVSPEQFRSISRAERASGIAALLRQKILRLDRLDAKIQTCWTALNFIRSPGNLGTLIRSSAAAGGSGFILLGDSIDPFDPVVVRSTMGTLFKQTLVRTGVEEFEHWVRANNLRVIGVSPDGEEDYRRISYSRPVILMLGSERKGLTTDQWRICDRIVRIPMVKGMDSLNVAVAGSLLMYEVFGLPRDP